MSLLRFLYNWLVRDYLPYKISVHNGVPVKGVVRLLDQTDTFPEYEGPLIRQIESQIEYDDNVVIVGGGLGVSTVAAARRTVKPGSVTTYEGGSEQVGQVKKTLKLNGVTERCSVLHAVVGENVGVYSDPGDAERVAPSDIEMCDVLVLDCEGSEVGIVNNLNFTPQTIIVETHGFLGASEKKVQDALTDNDYNVINREVENAENGIVILTGKSDR